MALYSAQSVLDDATMTLSDLTTTLLKCAKSYTWHNLQWLTSGAVAQLVPPTPEQLETSSWQPPLNPYWPDRTQAVLFPRTVCPTDFSRSTSHFEIVASRYQLDIQQAIAKLCAEVPYETAQALFEELSGISVSAERMHTLTNALADRLSVLDVAPDADEIRVQIRKLRAGKFRRPVMVLAIDGAHVPTRPDEAGVLRDAPKRQRSRSH